jgi:glycosyltransferase involved in cell wall biosynthesis
VIVARLFPEKNHRLLLAAFAEVAARVPEAKLLIVGDGMEQAAIEAVVAKLELGPRVRMLGVRRDIPLILAGADVFVLSSDREGLPIAVLEAMAAGLPVIATSVGDLPLVVRDGQTGVLVPRRDVGKLAGAMARLLGNTEESARMGRSGPELVEAGYSLEQMVARHGVLYGVAE